MSCDQIVPTRATLTALVLSVAAILAGFWSASYATAAPLVISGNPPKGRIVVGDSITVAASDLMRADGFTVNAKVGRQFASAPQILRSYGWHLPRNVVIELGTNGYIRRSDCQQVLAIAGPNRRVFFVTNRMARAWEGSNNRMLRQCATGGRAQIIDWHAASANAQHWFVADRVHLTRSGSIALSNLIDAHVDAAGS